MGARWYSPATGTFLSADSIVPEPGNPQDLNRYAYVRGNPLKYTDPTGHFSEDEIRSFFGLDKDAPWEKVLEFFSDKNSMYYGRWGWLEVLRRAQSGDVVWGLAYDPVIETASYSRIGQFDVRNGKVSFSWSDEAGNGGSNMTFISTGDDARMANRISRNSYGSAYGQYRMRGSEVNAYVAYKNYVHFDPDQVNWLMVGVDLVGTVTSFLGGDKVAAQLKWGAHVGKFRFVSQFASAVGFGNGVLTVDANSALLSFASAAAPPGPIAGGISAAAVYYDVKAGFLLYSVKNGQASMELIWQFAEIIVYGVGASLPGILLGRILRRRGLVKEIKPLHMLAMTIITLTGLRLLLPPQASLVFLAAIAAVSVPLGMYKNDLWKRILGRS